MNLSIARRCAGALILMLLCADPSFAQARVQQRIRTAIKSLPPREFKILYGSFATLQILDVHSTRRGVDETGAREVNPVLAPIAGSTVALLAVKAAATAFTMQRVERLRRRDSRRAKVLMVALNAAHAVIVVNNYRVGSRRR